MPYYIAQRKASSRKDAPASVIGVWPNTGLTHGSQLTPAMVGYGALGVTQSQLVADGVPSPDSFWRITVGMPRPPFIPAGNYVYNNNASNHGGTVPSGGMLIDGFSVPAGTWVCQFTDFQNTFYVEGTSGPGFVFRGCRFRGASRAPGWFNIVASPAPATSFWLHYSDFGGLGFLDAQYDESPLTMSYTSGTATLFRNYISLTSTGMNATDTNCTVVENLIEHIVFFYGDAGPPLESGPKHLNGIQWLGSPTNALVVRNKIVLENPDLNGREVNQTDAIMFNNSTGALLGTGTNIDGSTGYVVKDNWLGGGGYAEYGGLENGIPAQAANFKVTGNKFQTIGTWPLSGKFGPITNEPVWGSFGNIATNNRYGDGPNIGQLAFGS